MRCMWLLIVRQKTSWICAVHYFLDTFFLTLLGCIVKMSFSLCEYFVSYTLLWDTLRYFDILWSYFVKDESWSHLLFGFSWKSCFDKKALIRSSLRKKWRGFLDLLGIPRKALVSAFRLKTSGFQTVERGGWKDFVDCTKRRFWWMTASKS